MPPALVSSVADKVDGLDEEGAEDLWDEVKNSLQDEGELPENEDGFSDRDWGLLNDAFQDTVASRYDVDKDDLTEANVLAYFEGKGCLDDLFEGYSEPVEQVDIVNLKSDVKQMLQSSLDSGEVTEVKDDIGNLLFQVSEGIRGFANANQTNLSRSQIDGLKDTAENISRSQESF